MFKSAKISKIFVITLLSAILLLSITSSIASAQGQGSITLLDALGGSTDPAANLTTNYNDGTAVTLTATPLDGYVFVSWQIVTATSSSVVSDNPYSLTVAGGTDYAVQPIFDVIQVTPGGQPVTDFKTAAIVVVLRGAGGTTNPPPGTYALANAAQTTLTAIPDSGWQFSHWVITGDLGSISGHAFTPTPTDNPYTVDHGYASQFNYQPVFIPTGSTEPTPVGQTATPGPGIGGLSNEMVIIIALVVVIVIVLIAFGVFAMRKKK
jgi:hypothetical protein